MLPKVLWPVFEKSLLELQVAYARELGIKNIYINLHYQGEKIEAFCRNKAVFEGVHFLWEKPVILDIGGAVHHLASLDGVHYQGKLLILNADQFFHIPKDEFYGIIAPFDKSPAALFTYWVNSSLGYNALQIDSRRLARAIIPNTEIAFNSKIETYTGISIIDLSQLEKVSGVSKFFDSVCPLKAKEIPAILLDKIDYWDFGTLKRYWETSFQLLETYRTNSNHPFLRFLVSQRALKTWKIDLQNLSYHAQAPRVINLNQEPQINPLQPSIILTGQFAQTRQNPAVWWNELVEEIK